MSRFLGRSACDYRIKARALQSFAVELSFAARRREVAFCEGEKGAGRSITNHVGTDAFVRPAERSSARIFVAFKIQTDEVLALPSTAGDPPAPRVWGFGARAGE